jgi:hypothetical protein
MLESLEEKEQPDRIEPFLKPNEVGVTSRRRSNGHWTRIPSLQEPEEAASRYLVPV